MKIPTNASRSVLLCGAAVLWASMTQCAGPPPAGDGGRSASSAGAGSSGRGGTQGGAGSGASNSSGTTSTLGTTGSGDASVAGMGDAGAADAAGFSVSVRPVAVGGASTVTDNAAAGGHSVGLTGAGEGAQAAGLPAASRLAIHYASVSVGTIGVSVNGGTPVKVNVHSSGALTGSFLYAILDLAIPAGATLTVTRSANDVGVNVDQIVVGTGSLGLPPDIWNLSPFKVAAGPYTADWKALGLAYSTPEWWRDAKLGAWAHWDPQFMPEQGDWYAYRMYQEGSADFNYQVSHFGDPSSSGYKDICENWKIDQWDPGTLMALYVQMGAKFFMAMGSHHDNFACYDTIYQP